MGDARIGVAVSDETGLIATPRGAISRTSPVVDVDAILHLAAELGAHLIVVGLPVSLDGTHGPQVRKVLAFQRALEEAADLPVETWDERFSTVEAERRLREGGLRPSRDRARLDSEAAAVILQGYLDSHTHAAG